MILDDNSKADFKNLLWDSQRCQRNWDLTKTIPSEDIELMVHACKSSPSKQNEPHFRVYGVENFDLRKKIYNETLNFAHDGDGVSLCFNKDGSINYKRQSQLMGNFLFVFCRERNNVYRSGESYAGGDFVETDMNVDHAGTIDLSTDEKRKYVQKMTENIGLHAIGISVGYLLITAHMLGYKTGCSSGFHIDTVVEITGHSNPEIVVAVGYGDETRDRREEHFERGRLFPSWNKDINFKIIK